MMNLIEISHQHAITSAIRHQTNLKHSAATISHYFNQLNWAKLCKYVILTSFSKSNEILFQSTKLILMFFLFEEHTCGLDIHTLCNFSSLRILHVTIQILIISGCCSWYMGDLGKNLFCVVMCYKVTEIKHKKN